MSNPVVHGYDGTREYNGPSYEGKVYACECGEWFVHEEDQEVHIEGHREKEREIEREREREEDLRLRKIQKEGA